MSASYGTAPVSVLPASVLPRVSFSAIFAGVVLVVAVELVLAVLGAGVGLGFVNPKGSTPGIGSFGTGAAVWWLVSTVIALVVGGLATARLAGTRSRADGVLHGLVIWGLTMLLTVYLLTSAVGGLIGGAFSVIGGTVSAVGSAAGSGASQMLPRLEQATGLNADILQQQATDLLQSPTPQDPAAMSRADAVKAIGQALPGLVTGGPQSDASRQRIIAIVAAQAKISPQDAQDRVAKAVDRIDRLKQQALAEARQAAQASAASASHASFLAVIGMLIGAAAAAAGGAAGARPRPV